VRKNFLGPLRREPGTDDGDEEDDDRRFSLFAGRFLARTTTESTRVDEQGAGSAFPILFVTAFR
jgi:hypothetical protein